MLSPVLHYSEKEVTGAQFSAIKLLYTYNLLG